MRELMNFDFEGAVVRTVTGDDGEPLFVGKDVCDVLGYSNATDAMNQHCRGGVAKRYPIVDSLGRPQEVRVLSEPDVLRLIVRSKLPSAEKFERWVFEDLLPTIRRTGTYNLPKTKAKPAGPSGSALAEARAINFIGDIVAKVYGARLDVVAVIKLRMIEARTGLPATEFGTALPAASHEDAIRLNPTEIGRRIGDKTSAQRVNKALLELGLHRKSESGWVLTEAGLAFGEARPFQAANKHVGDQIDWHEAVVARVRAHLGKPEGELASTDAGKDLRLL